MIENYPPKAEPSPAGAPQTSTLAIVSLVSGIVTWFLLPLLGAITAIITGHMAKSEIRNNPGQYSGDGMATAGLILGYAHILLAVVPLCIIGILFLLGPAIGDVFSSINMSLSTMP